MAMKIISVTDIDGFRLGNAENSEKGTGCTVIICEEGAVGGVDVRGGGPATRETDLLRSENTVNAVNAVVLSGGSAFGLEAASGVMRELSERNIGFNVGDGIVVPIVCGASLFDLPVGDPKAFPDIFMGIQAVRNAYSGSFSNGNHGAGTGATVGKLKGYDRAMKSGLGAFACGDGIVEVGAIAAVNAVGDIYNGAGKIVAGLRSEDGQSIYGTIKTLKGMVHDRAYSVDESTSFINKYEIEEALAAAAKQYEEEEAAAEKAAEAVSEPAAEEAAELITEASAEETVEEAAETVDEPAAADEPILTEASAEPAEVFAEETAEPVLTEEPAESDTEEAEESAEAEPILTEESAEPEFIPETPAVNVFEDSARGYDEISISAEAQEAAAGYFRVSDGPSETTEEAIVTNPEESSENLTEEQFVVSAEAEEAPEEPSTAESPAEVTENETIAEDAAEMAAEETAEEPAPQAPAELTREEMGYDIVFNTTISCLITNAALTKSQANKLASILHDAYARAIKPVHGTMDGDTVFVLSTGKQEVNFDAFAALAADVMQYAVIDGAMSAKGAYGLPSAKDMQK